MLLALRQQHMMQAMITAMLTANVGPYHSRTRMPEIDNILCAKSTENQYTFRTTEMLETSNYKVIGSHRLSAKMPWTLNFYWTPVVTQLSDRSLLCFPSNQRAGCNYIWPHFRVKGHRTRHCCEVELLAVDTWLLVGSKWDSHQLMGKIYNCQSPLTSWSHQDSTLWLGHTTPDRELPQSAGDHPNCMVPNGPCTWVLLQICDTWSTPDTKMKWKLDCLGNLYLKKKL